MTAATLLTPKYGNKSDLFSKKISSFPYHNQRKRELKLHNTSPGFLVSFFSFMSKFISVFKVIWLWERNADVANLISTVVVKKETNKRIQSNHPEWKLYSPRHKSDFIYIFYSRRKCSQRKRRKFMRRRRDIYWANKIQMYTSTKTMAGCTITLIEERMSTHYTSLQVMLRCLQTLK